MPPLYVHIPAQLLASRLPFLLNRQLQPEVACQMVRVEHLDLEQITACSARLAAAGLRTSLHAPFAAFNPGSPKKRLQKKAHAICELSFELAQALDAQLIVFHPGLPVAPSAKQTAQWLQQSLAFWPTYVQRAEQRGLQVCIENIFEADPQPLFELFEGLQSPAFGHCFDIGHWHMFATGCLEDWFATLGPHIRHLHLHDNHGQQDEHLPIDQGLIDFPALFAQVEKLAVAPSMTLEAHTPAELTASLDALERYFPDITKGRP